MHFETIENKKYRKNSERKQREKYNLHNLPKEDKKKNEIQFILRNHANKKGSSEIFKVLTEKTPPT